MPQCWANLKNYSITIAIFESHFNVALLPQIKAPNNCKAGISKGKLKGAITATEPKGNL